MRVASILAVSALALGYIHSPALAQNPPPTPLPTASEREEVRTTYIFKFDESVDRGEMAARAQQAVAGTGGSLRHVYTEVLGGFAATVPATALWNVARRPGIVSFEQDQIFTIVSSHKNCDDPNPHPSCKGGDGDGGTDDGGTGDGGTGGGGVVDLSCPDVGSMPWGVNHVHKGTKPEATSCGEGIDVYVLDTGIDLDHENLVPVGKSVDCTSGCAIGGDDKNGHGTHVAGTIGARGKSILGVAPAVHLHGVQVLKPSGMGSMSDIIAGIQYVAKEAQTVDEEGNLRGPVVANMSLGGSGSKAGTCHATDQDDSPEAVVYFVGTGSLHKAMCDAAHDGVVFVVAAGNSGADAAGFVPAAFDDVAITASATSESKNWPSWSNWGDGDTTWTDAHAITSAPVAVAAPGVSIESTKKDGGTTVMSGTSMASPHVAGVAALLLQANAPIASDYSAFSTMRDAILDIATPTTADNGFDNNTGKPHDESFACAVTGCAKPTQTQ